ncbi:MAG: DUF1211 domain-containing protein [Cyanothece sp. SIO2G6]|nr:DUF1211 domain-containing protein [Cyanothece sp. SIO2G6]
MPIQRLTRLSDIVFAVAMTILALVFDPISAEQMSPDALTELLLQQLPSIGVYAITFVTIGFYWFTHVHQFKYYQTTDAIHTFLSLFSLVFVVLLPYASELSEFHDGVFAIQVFYSLVAAGVGIFSSAAWIYGTQNRRLVDNNLPDVTIRHIRRESFTEPLIALLAIAGAWLAPWGWSVTFLVGFPLAFFIQAQLSSKDSEVTEGAIANTESVSPPSE